MSPSSGSGAPGPTLDDLGEDGVLERVFARLPRAGEEVLVGPGDDAAVLRGPHPLLVSTDTLVRGRDWRDEWSRPQDVGAKAVVQNLADLAAMGGCGSGLLVTLVAPGSLPVAWAEGLTEGVAAAAGAAGVPVVGGDLSSSEGAVMVSVTVFGHLPGPGPVLRSGAAVGQVVAVSGPLGRSEAGLTLLRRSDAGWWPAPEAVEQAELLVAYHCRPDPDLSQGPAAARAGAGALIDVSDGLVRDGGRVARASRVRVDLDARALADLGEPIARVLGPQEAWRCVLTGGEEHTLLGTFEPSAVPPGWTVIGRVEEGEGVWCRGRRLTGGGWDHFGPGDDERPAP
ncbi:MAG TPA: thiamine-phosphate kinase [Ornithinicoccus sp.]|jgi:thiamine-monophosphate kinase|nr:thiamine-phosphate kinase [Ornithinicoccus sp.]